MIIQWVQSNFEFSIQFRSRRYWCVSSAGPTVWNWLSNNLHKSAVGKRICLPGCQTLWRFGWSDRPKKFFFYFILPKNKVKKGLPARNQNVWRNKSRVRLDHPRCRSATWICIYCHTHDLVIYSTFHRNPSRSFGAPGVSKFGQSRYFGYWLLQPRVYYRTSCVNIYRACLLRFITRKTVLDRGSRSDRPRYYVTTTIRAGHWHLTLTYDLDFQSQASYGHVPRHTENSISNVSRFVR